MATTYTVPRGASRVIDEFSVEIDGVAQDLTAWTVTVVVDSDLDATTTPAYSADCVAKEGDATKRLVKVEGAATANTGKTVIERPGCVHVTNPDGSADSIAFKLRVEPHV